MRISDIQIGRTIIVELRLVGVDRPVSTLARGAEVQIYYSAVADETLIKVDSEIWPVEGTDANNAELLVELCESTLPRLCWLANQHDAGVRLVVQAHLFPMAYDSAEPLEIAVSDAIVETTIAKLLRRKAETAYVLDWLSENSVIDSSQSCVVLISAGESARLHLGSAFRIHGRRVNIDVTRTGLDNGYRITRVVNARRSDQEMVMMWRGPVTYRDATALGELRGRVHTQLDSILQQADSYLALWRQYNRLERESIVRRARELGWLKYRRCEQLPDGEKWRFWLAAKLPEEMLSYLSDDHADLEAAASLPEELRNDSMAVDGADAAEIVEGPLRSWLGRCESADGSTLILRPADPDRTGPPPDAGYLYISLIGDRIRLKRRDTARDRIAYAQNSMPQLALLLEGQSMPVSTHRKIKVHKRDISAVFDGNPTDRQREAIHLAVNTPDIALIQGPPGTGKTRVIAAIERILASDAKANGITDRVLLTSYQHDAVENAASYSVLELPPLKVGRRSGRRSETDGFADNVARWVKDRIAVLKADLIGYQQIPVAAASRTVRGLVASYVNSPGSRQESADLLASILEQAGEYLSQGLRGRLLERIHRIRAELPIDASDREQQELLMRAIRALRTEANAFVDDGSLMAYKLLHRLEGTDWLSESDRHSLELAASWEDGEVLDFLAVLQSIKERLLDRAQSPGLVERTELVSADVEALLMEVADALHAEERRSRGGEVATIDEYLHDLEYDPLGVQDTLRIYTAVLAATCQQSVSKPMERLTRDSIIEFDTVIVDEAARANPLDLMIPMSLARRRIILVGDQRQLPHILEPDVERQLEISEETTQASFRESLFGRLFRQAQELELRGDIKRAITLDTQYRMHPALGRFVSEVFYASSEQFGSPLPESDFAHDLEPFVGRVAAWIDVPSGLGLERDGRSKSRRVEALRVAEVTRRILRQRPDFSVGVITFYAAQALAILRELRGGNLVEEVDGVLQVASAFRETRDEHGRLTDRLRIGTVDAFQGKEFDVVVLSMTRSNRQPAHDEVAWRRKYGFLTLENRLCVAMSRQKRLLVVVGDKDMVRGPSAEKAIPGLSRFYELCGGDYGLRL